MVLYLLFTHATSSIIIISLVVGFLLTITYVLFLKRRHRYERRHFGAVIEDLRKKEEEEKELLFTQLLQWREFAEEYKTIVVGLLPSIENSTLAGVVAELEDRFEHLYQVTEKDRKKFMSELSKKDDYSEEYKKVFNHLFNKLTGMDTGQKAADTPLLNDNRDN